MLWKVLYNFHSRHMFLLLLSIYTGQIATSYGGCVYCFEELLDSFVKFCTVSILACGMWACWVLHILPSTCCFPLASLINQAFFLDSHLHLPLSETLGVFSTLVFVENCGKDKNWAVSCFFFPSVNLRFIFLQCIQLFATCQFCF